MTSISVALWLPDSSDSLATRPEYAIRLASDGVWDAASGLNVLWSKLVVDATVRGDVDRAAAALAVLP